MKARNYVYILCMFFFAVISYLLFDRGFNVKTRLYVDYKENSNITYKVYLHENDEYKEEYLKMNERYISELVDKIKVDFKYNKLFSKDVNGYYSYDVSGKLYAFLKDTNEIVWSKDYHIMDNKTTVVNQNNVKKVDIEDKVLIDFDKYRDDLVNFSKKYTLNLNGYLDVFISINENFNFSGIDKLVTEKRKMLLRIPLSDDTFKINIENDNNRSGRYDDFSTREKVNYFLLILGAFNLSLAISFLALVIREMVISSSSQSKYTKELKKILNLHDDKLISVKRFYNKKKYNLIYVDSFKELLDVYDRVGNPISYREIKKNEEVIFLIIEDDNAWIYRLIR